MDTLIYLIVYLVVLAVVVMAGKFIVDTFFPASIKMVMYLILGAIALVGLLGIFAGYGPTLIMHRP